MLPEVERSLKAQLEADGNLSIVESKSLDVKNTAFVSQAC